jgi:hypothetical protein
MQPRHALGGGGITLPPFTFYLPPDRLQRCGKCFLRGIAIRPSFCLYLWVHRAWAERKLHRDFTLIVALFRNPQPA